MSNDDHDLGFAHDLPRMLKRRHFLAALGGIGMISATTPASAALQCVALPWETAGPYPADASNTRDGQVVNVLTQQGVIREDLRTSFGDYTGTAEGVRLDLTLTLVNADGCTPLAGRALYLWACDAEGSYSLYDTPSANYMRGVGIADPNGVIKFTTIFPACYAGRWPHFHFEIFENAEAAVSGEASLLTAQIALPEADCVAVYEQDERYRNSSRNLGRVTLDRDMVFRDNSEAQLEQQMLALNGSPASGYAGTLTIPVDFTAEKRVERAPPPGAPGRQPEQEQ